METQIIYQINQTDFEKVLNRQLNEVQKQAAYSRYRGRLVNPNIVAAIHKISRDTVISYTKAGLLAHIKQGSYYLYDLADVLEFDFVELKKLKSNKS